VAVAEYALGPIGEAATPPLSLVAQRSESQIPGASAPQLTQDIALVEKFNSL